MWQLLSWVWVCEETAQALMLVLLLLLCLMLLVLLQCLMMLVLLVLLVVLQEQEWVVLRGVGEGRYHRYQQQQMGEKQHHHLGCLC